MDFSVINSNSEADVWVSNVRTHDDVILADIHLLAQREVILQPFGVFFLLKVPLLLLIVPLFGLFLLIFNHFFCLF